MNQKTTFYLKLVLFSTVLLLFTNTNQAQERSCGMVEYMEEQMKDPEYAKQFKITQAKFRTQLEKNLNGLNAERRMNTIIIPVAVHFPSGLESDRACLEALAQNQIDILNEDFTGTNPDISGWTAAAPFYPGVNTGAADFLFCIATMNHPTGLDPEMVEGGPAVTIGYNFGNGNETDSNWAGYMNFLIKDIGGGLLGFSPFPGSVAAGQSVTMNLGAFGSGAGCPNSGIVPGAPYDLGRTVTHELGHFYNLDHTFGSCGTDDGIADTPNQGNSNGGCPTLGTQPACDASEQELFQSYMDYTNDACMFMFSAGQISVAEAYVMSIQSTFKPNVVSCSAAPDFQIASANSPLSFCGSDNDAVFNLSYTALGGYTDTTTLSASGLPSGATSTFSPATINADGDFTLTVGNLSGATTGNYTITVTGTGTVTNSFDVDLFLVGSAPVNPSLTSPANNATDTSTMLDLVWSATADTESYTVELATDMAFGNIIASNTLTDTMFTVSGLTETTDYYWRVRGTNGCGDSTNSTVYKFTTASITCATLNSTENNINIPASGNTAHVVTSTLTVTDAINITDIDVTVNIQHDWAGDMEIKLTSPAGTEVILNANSTCDSGANDIFVTFNDQASGPVSCSNTSPAIGGNIQPANPLSAFNGESTVGNWILTATDGYPSLDGGTFQNFSLDICGASLLSVDEFSLANTLNIWPNPSNGEINLSLNTKNNDNVNVALYDLRGRLINEQSFINSGNFTKKLNYQSLESAVYILSIENAGQIINKRIIIE